MKLLQLTADHPGFAELRFQDGINLLQEPILPANFRKKLPDTSLVLSLIRFCLGGCPADGLSELYPGWRFSLAFEQNGKACTAERSTEEKASRIIRLGDEKLSVYEMERYMLHNFFPSAPSHRNLTWPTLLLRFAPQRRESRDPLLRMAPKEGAFTSMVNTAYLLGLNLELLDQKKEFRKLEVIVNNTEREMSTDPVYRKYIYDAQRLETDMIAKQEEIEEMKNRISQCQVALNYDSVQKERERKKAELNQVKKSIVGLKERIEQLDVEIMYHLLPDKTDGMVTYDTAETFYPPPDRLRLEDAIEERTNFVLSRGARLRMEIERKKAMVKSCEGHAIEIEKQIAELSKVLDKKSSAEKYTELQKQLAGLEGELEHLRNFQDLYERYEITVKRTQSNRRFGRQATTDYLRSKTEELEWIDREYLRLAEPLISQSGAVSLKIETNTGRNDLCYDIHAETEHREYTATRLAMDLLLSIHGKETLGWIFPGRSMVEELSAEKQKALLEEIAEICKETSLQCFCVLTEEMRDDLPEMMAPEEYRRLISDRQIEVTSGIQK